MKFKLSEAVLRGSEGRPQCFGQLYDHCYTELGEPDEVRDDSPVCAMGAAYVDRYGPDVFLDERDVAIRLEDLDCPPVVLEQNCPVEGCLHAALAGQADLISTVTHLNDAHRWSFTEIADWLKNLGA